MPISHIDAISPPAIVSPLAGPVVATVQRSADWLAGYAWGRAGLGLAFLPRSADRSRESLGEFLAGQREGYEASGVVVVDAPTDHPVRALLRRLARLAAAGAFYGSDGGQTYAQIEMEASDAIHRLAGRNPNRPEGPSAIMGHGWNVALGPSGWVDARHPKSGRIASVGLVLAGMQPV